MAIAAIYQNDHSIDTVCIDSQMEVSTNIFRHVNIRAKSMYKMCSHHRDRTTWRVNSWHSKNSPQNVIEQVRIAFEENLVFIPG